MSKHWNPRLVAGGGRRGRPRGRFRPGEMRLAALFGLAAGLIAAGVPALRPNASAPVVTEPVDAGLVRVIDGDTFDYRGQRIRIADIDTPEVEGRCPYETELAAKATVRMAALLGEGPFELEPVERDEDRYGRKLRVVTRGGHSLGDVLVAEGLARTWTGRREPWC